MYGPYVSKLIEYESGELGFDEVVLLFQGLLDSGMIHHLQGHYGRVMRQLIDEGYVFEGGE